jgi:hypothetical protein
VQASSLNKKSKKQISSVLSPPQLPGDAQDVRVLVQPRPESSELRRLRKEVLPAAKVEDAHEEDAQR